METSMKTIRGPAIFLAQFAGDAPPFNSLAGMAGWAASLGFTGVQIPTWDARLFDLEKAASSKAYCDEVKGTLAAHGLVVTELATHLQGHLVAVHPGEDLFDGATFEMFLGRLDGHPRCGINYDPSHFVLQCLDYLEFIDLYHERIFAFHVKDAEFNPTGRQGVYGGFQSWVNRAGRFRSLGDGQVDFPGIFSKLTQYGYAGWAAPEGEYHLKHPEHGAREGSA